MEAEQMKNREFVFACLHRLQAAGALTETVLALLTDPETCRREFCMSSGFAVLQEVPSHCGAEQLTALCHVGTKRRYYQEVFRHGERAFVAVNHWYGPGRSMPDNRTPFLRWVEGLTERARNG